MFLRKVLSYLTKHVTKMIIEIGLPSCDNNGTDICSEGIKPELKRIRRQCMQERYKLTNHKNHSMTSPIFNHVLMASVLNGNTLLDKKTSKVNRNTQKTRNFTMKYFRPPKLTLSSAVKFYSIMCMQFLA